jgi:hypothetical protein
MNMITAEEAMQALYQMSGTQSYVPSTYATTAREFSPDPLLAPQAKEFIPDPLLAAPGRSS